MFTFLIVCTRELTSPGRLHFKEQKYMTPVILPSWWQQVKSLVKMAISRQQMYSPCWVVWKSGSIAFLWRRNHLKEWWNRNRRRSPRSPHRKRREEIRRAETIDRSQNNCGIIAYYHIKCSICCWQWNRDVYHFWARFTISLLIEKIASFFFFHLVHLSI